MSLRGRGGAGMKQASGWRARRGTFARLGSSFGVTAPALPALTSRASLG